MFQRKINYKIIHLAHFSNAQYKNQNKMFNLNVNLLHPHLSLTVSNILLVSACQEEHEIIQMAHLL